METRSSNGRAARERGWKSIALAATGFLLPLLVGVIGIRLAIEFAGSSAREPRGESLAQSVPSTALEASEPAAAAASSSRTPVEAVALETAPSVPETSSVQATEARASLRKNLTTAIEMSLSGALEPTTILRTGLALVDLHLAKDDLPTTAPDGSLRYPLKDCPAGVHAELLVARSPAVKDGNVLSLRVEVDAPSEPYLLEGAVRKPPIVYLQAFLDRDGRMKDFVLMTDVSPSSASKKFGLDVLEGRVPQGIVFHVDMSRPSEWNAESYGLDDGKDRSWSDPVAILGDPWPEPSSLAQLGSGLLGLLSEARR